MQIFGSIGHEWRKRIGRFTIYQGADFIFEWQNIKGAYSLSIGDSSGGIEALTSRTYFGEENVNIGVSGLLGGSFHLDEHFSLFGEAHIRSFLSFRKYVTGTSNIRDNIDYFGADEKGVGFVLEVLPIYYLGVAYRF